MSQQKDDRLDQHILEDMTVVETFSPDEGDSYEDFHKALAHLMDEKGIGFTHDWDEHIIWYV